MGERGSVCGFGSSEGAYARRRQSRVSVQEIRVFAREDVVRNGRNAVVVSQTLTQLEHKRRLARSYGPVTILSVSALRGLHEV